MNRYIKSTLIVVAGLCWLAFAMAIGFFLIQYLGEGSGSQAFGFFGVSSSGILIGLVHVAGFVAAACICFVIGAGVCAHGLVPAPEPEGKIATRPKKGFAFRHFVASAIRREDTDTVNRCVCCRVALDAPVHICSECGWTQPYVEHTREGRG